MGTNISTSSFSEADYQAFDNKLLENLVALKQLLSDTRFGIGDTTIGAELELCLIDKLGRPAYVNETILQQVNTPQLTLELNQYNLEYNLLPYAIKKQAFFALQQELTDVIQLLNTHAKAVDARVVPIGILPTLQQRDFGTHAISNKPRYHALTQLLRKIRGDDFHININGVEPLKLDARDISLEAANTSFQMHYRVAPNDFADSFNAFQLVTPLVLAISGNSPLFLGHQLWQETRIPLFKQSIDTRIKDRYQWHQSPRVTFGNGWVRHGAYELFAESVHLHPAIMPVCDEQDPLKTVKAGQIPLLSELGLQQSTVWWWNRPVYDASAGGHLRIEMRSLPAGPTPADMVANAALHIGLAEGMKAHMHQLLPAIPFELARYNFYRSAQQGLSANLVWPAFAQNIGSLDKPLSGKLTTTEIPVTELLNQYLEVAAQGLESIDVSHAEAEYYLSIIRKRLNNRQTGSAWQLKTLAQLEQKFNRDEALQRMLNTYVTNSLSNTPVAEWA